MYPSRKEISPTGGLDLDEQCALNNFYGLDGDAALKMFERDSDYLHIYFADLVHMGPVAFEYYAAVLERYLLGLSMGDFIDEAQEAVDYLLIRFHGPACDSAAMNSLVAAVERRKSGI